MGRRLLLVLSLALLVDRVKAQCPASLSVTQPDANGIVTVVASTNGSCATTSLHLTLDGGNLDEKACPATECRWTTTIDAKCLGAYGPTTDLTHVVGLWTTCGTSGTDQNGHPTCESAPIGNASGTFTINPKPTIHVDPGSLDEKGKGVATVTYSFPYNENFGDVQLTFDNHCCSTCAFCTHPTGTWVVPYAFTCGDPGTHTLVAQAFACNGINPDFIATDTETVDVSGQTTVHASYDEDAKTLAISSHFPNTETPASNQRSITAFVDGQVANIGTGGSCIAQVTNTCTVNLALSCGTEHVIRLVANGCGRSEPMYNAEDSVTVTPICSNDTQCRHSPSTAQELGAMLDTQNSGDSCDLCVGQPVHVGSGDVTITLPLFTIAGSPMRLPFRLNYHSLKPSFPAALDYPLGPGWTHQYNMSVRPAGGGARLQYFTPTGNRLYFDQVTPSLWAASRPAFITDTITKDGGTYSVNYVNGGRSLFSAVTGKWLSTVDRWGNTISGAYDAAGNLIAVTDPDGRQISLDYTNDLLSRITLPNGAAWTFTYSTLGPRAMLTAINDPLNPSLHWRTFEYVLQSDGVYRSLSAMRDSAGKLLEGHNYEVSGDNKGVTSYSEGGRNSYLLEFGHPSPGHTRVTRDINDSTAQVTVYGLESMKGSWVATQIDGVCASCGSVTDSQMKTYDKAGRLLSVTDAAGQTTRYSYDAFGSMLTRTEAAGTALERMTTFAYENPRWPSFVTRVTMPSATGNGLRVVQSQWNADETLLTITDTGSERTTVFDAKHRIIREDGPRTDVADVTTRTWSSDGRLQQVTTPTGLTTSYASYDFYGTAQRITDPNGVVTQLQTDLRGRVTSSTSLPISGDPNESAAYTTSTIYDAQDRVAEITNPRGAKTRYAYEVGTNALTDIVRVDFAGNEVERKHLTLNTAGDRTAEEDQRCTAPSATCASWITTRSVAFAYDIKNRLVEIDQPVPPGAKLLYRYDANGRLQSSQDENHNSPNTTYAYDELSRLAAVTQASAVTRYGYDAQGNLNSVTDPNGNVTTYGYDDLGRMQRQVSPVTGTTTYACDAAGNLLSTTDANGATTVRTYDAANRVLSSTSTRSGAPSESVSWTYDDTDYGRGRVASVSDPTGTTRYRYERRGFPRSEEKTIEGNAYTTTFNYDAAGNRIRMGYPSGRIVNLSFDFADRPISASLGSVSLIGSATYAPFGPLTQIAFGNGTTKTMQLDARYRPVENKLTGPAGVIADYMYGEDPAGNIKEIHDAVDPSFNRDFGYDDLNRLTVANSGSGLWGSGTYSYDAMGNLTVLNIGRSVSFSYVGSTPKLANVGYDAAGNESSAGGENFVYSARNSLAETDRQQFLYDGRGVRTITFERGSVAIGGLQLTPPSVVGGSTADASVMLSGNTTSDLLVSIARSGSTAASAPAEVTVPAGQSSASFTITTTPVVAHDTATFSVFANQSSASAILIITPPPVTLAAVVVQPSSVIGGLTSTGVVTLSGGAPNGGAVIVLSSSDPSMAVLPASIVIPGGSTTGSFAIGTASTLTPAVLNVSASWNGASQSAVLTVMPPTALSLFALSVDPINVAGGAPSIGTVTLSGVAPNGGVDVALASSDPAVASVPSRVRVRGGDLSATFNITTFAVTSNAAIAISGSYGQLGQSDTLTVIPATSIHLLSLSISPASVAGGSSSTGTVTIDSPAPAGGILISVSSKQKKLVTVPDSVLVPGGAATGRFAIATKSVKRIDTADVKASWAGVTKTATITVSPLASTILRRTEGRQKLAFSVSAQMVSQPARRYSFYSPELRLVAESETTSAPTPHIAYEYIWFNGQPLAQLNNSTGEISWYFDDHLGTPILQTSASGASVWRVEREPYGARYSVRAGKDRYQPLALPGQEDDAASDRSYNIFRWYRAGWGRYTEPDPFELAGGVNLYAYSVENPVRLSDRLGLDTVGCDMYGLGRLRVETRCELQCCARHDECYDDNHCSSGSWPGSTPQCGCDRTTGCRRCNEAAVFCIANCLSSSDAGSSTEPLYYCGAQHRYVRIPGDFQNRSAAQSACDHDYASDCRLPFTRPRPQPWYRRVFP